MATTAAQKRASRKYDAENTVRISLKLNRKTDADVLQRLEEVGSRQGYIKALIRADIFMEAEEEKLHAKHENGDL